MTPLDLRPPLALFFPAFGVPAVVTRPAPDDEPIEATGIWLAWRTESMPGDLDFQRRDPQRVIVFRVSDVPTLPRGTLIEAPARKNADNQTWRVDGVELVEPDELRVMVVPIGEAS